MLFQCYLAQLSVCQSRAHKLSFHGDEIIYLLNMSSAQWVRSHLEESIWGTVVCVFLFLATYLLIKIYIQFTDTSA